MYTHGSRGNCDQTSSDYTGASDRPVTYRTVVITHLGYLSIWTVYLAVVCQVNHMMKIFQDIEAESLKETERAESLQLEVNTLKQQVQVCVTVCDTRCIPHPSL